ncbi:hypothetical protein [Pseudomonas mandelii]|uniref:Uncharacterized protein n=1 Tax=Pseudomonas mandelii TaxID=75612 RepID=A0AB36CYX0_9PSED|nr:hypothetical protein [Pseudomonas mandelii]NMZ81357.1 hypothetical protein [Pseudomonas mandelii]
MNEVKRYHVSETGLSEGLSLGRTTVVLVADFDRVTAERDALQQSLTAADQRVDDLETEFKVTKQALNSLKGERDDLPASKVQCQFPQSCTTRCDCNIPDFSPGNGNKARRRAESIHGFKIVVDPTMAPNEIRFCNCNQGRLPCDCKPSAYDGFDNGSD